MEFRYRVVSKSGDVTGARQHLDCQKNWHSIDLYEGLDTAASDHEFANWAVDASADVLER